jgi:CheY-like chemotaxis protein
LENHVTMSNPEEAGATLDIVYFREQVRHALEHLYDADVLADHWLTHQLRLAHLPTGSRTMRQTLIDGIQSMRPTQGEPPGSQRWQMHQILLQRYVQQISPAALADQQGMSDRTLRRLQRRALAQLAEILLLQIQRQEEMTPSSRIVGAVEESSAITSTPTQWIKTVDDEIGWMRNTSLSEAVDAAALLAEALETIAPLVLSANTLINNKTPSTLPEVSIHPSGLRQVFLSVLNHAVKDATNGSVELSATSDETQLTITVRSVPAQGRLPTNLPEPQMIVARRILSVFGGQIEQMQESGGSLCVQITLMVAGGTPVLAIDDNADVLQLYERYVLGTRYRLTLCQKAESALQMVTALHPQIIIMDIMMPGLDGWSLLGQLCHHPATASIPVIVSTIVAERDLALTLGAVDFVQKPVTRGEFLDALTRAVGKAAPTPR